VLDPYDVACKLDMRIQEIMLGGYRRLIVHLTMIFVRCAEMHKTCDRELRHWRRRELVHE
jgi:hypothetical protein